MFRNERTKNRFCRIGKRPRNHFWMFLERWGCVKRVARLGFCAAASWNASVHLITNTQYTISLQETVGAKQVLLPPYIYTAVAWCVPVIIDRYAIHYLTSNLTDEMVKITKDGNNVIRLYLHPVLASTWPFLSIGQVDPEKSMTKHRSTTMNKAVVLMALKNKEIQSITWYSHRWDFLRHYNGRYGECG